MSKFKLRCGDNIELLKKLPDNSIDAIVSDPPYGLSFMGKKWDYDVPSVEFWKEVYRVLKPGGHVLSFGGTRTYHRMVVNIEDAGFEIRDQIMWLYGSGFPKSHNIGKAVDKLQGNKREIVGEKEQTGAKFKSWSDDPEQTRWHNQGFNKLDGKTFGITKGQSKYEGWGTALKPANEPICLARKPLSEKSVAENVLKWGTGGINIDGCRIKFNGDKPKECELVDFRGNGDQMNLGASGKERKTIEDKNYIPNDEGRFPANIILECICDEVIKGEKFDRKPRPKVNDHNENSIFGIGGVGVENYDYNDKGDIHTNPMCPCRLMDEQSSGASRFFMNVSYNNLEQKEYRFAYQAKVSKKERNMSGKCSHPTLKPIQLMSYLCKLITTPGGIILDPFAGSGSTGIAALLNGFRFIGMEKEQEYFDIMEKRVNDFESYRQFLKK
jgi:DNA modification methylase